MPDVLKLRTPESFVKHAPVPSQVTAQATAIAEDVPYFRPGQWAVYLRHVPTVSVDMPYVYMYIPLDPPAGPEAIGSEPPFDIFLTLGKKGDEFKLNSKEKEAVLRTAFFLQGHPLVAEEMGYVREGRVRLVQVWEVLEYYERELWDE
ncbi:hypothetical protein FISHEDRAFT_69211 [Fistulina hepatica ATCC 64428]|uniref:Uncharacterized protein n=1 Tax=Fistulina hepatica ATCC 64428 TaxID=1128425 RepID=A0A0D7AN95_9AGAR|nr:hypothetical protein FISHEDRAFT_69211 [Fistulina hepatica ATCC 64428]